MLYSTKKVRNAEKQQSVNKQVEFEAEHPQEVHEDTSEQPIHEDEQELH